MSAYWTRTPLLANRAAISPPVVRTRFGWIPDQNGKARRGWKRSEGLPVYIFRQDRPEYRLIWLMLEGHVRLPQRLRSRRQLQDVGIDRHLSQPPASRSKDCIGDCWNHGRCAGFAHAARRFQADHDKDLDLRRLVHAQHLVA